MNLPAGLFPAWLCIGACVIAGLLLARSIYKTAWLTVPQSELTCWFGGTVLMLVLWQMKANIQPGLTFHLLGAAGLTLIAGPDRARIGVAVALVADILDGHGDWSGIGLSWLLTAGIPTTLTWQLLKLAQKRLPHNYFVYIFLNSFAAGALSMWLVGISTCALLWATGVYAPDFLLEEQLPYYLLFGFPEAFTTGMVMTMLVIYAPQWVVTFDDQLYLRNK
ncbi:hypothetical protein JCM19000A_11490 [Silvimonas sp. JCM 19000]